MTNRQQRPQAMSSHQFLEEAGIKPKRTIKVGSAFAHIVLDKTPLRKANLEG